MPLQPNPAQTGQIIDRSAASRELAKAIAYAQCGKHDLACEWARKLITRLQCADILRTEHESARATDPAQIFDDDD